MIVLRSSGFAMKINCKTNQQRSDIGLQDQPRSTRVCQLVEQLSFFLVQAKKQVVHELEPRGYCHGVKPVRTGISRRAKA